MLTSRTLYCTKGGLTYLPLWKDVTLSLYKIGTCIHQHFLYSISRKCCTIYDHINYFRRFPFFSTLKTPSSTKHEFVQTSQSPNMGHWVHMTRNCGYGETIFGFTNLLTPNFVVGFCTSDSELNTSHFKSCHSLPIVMIEQQATTWYRRCGSNAMHCC